MVHSSVWGCGVEIDTEQSWTQHTAHQVVIGPGRKIKQSEGKVHAECVTGVGELLFKLSTTFWVTYTLYRILAKHITPEPGHLGQIHLGCTCNSCVNVLLICCCITNYPNILWLKIIMIYFTHESVHREFGQYRRNCSSVYMMSGAFPGCPEQLGARAMTTGARWASVLLHVAPPPGSLQPPPSMMASRCLRALRASILRDRKWKLPNSWGQDPNTGKASLLPYSISQSRQVYWEMTPFTGRVSKNLWTFLLCQNVLRPAPWFLHTSISSTVNMHNNRIYLIDLLENLIS